MTDALHVPSQPIRVVTAASLFDGHDAAINIMRRILQAQGAEVIHLGPRARSCPAPTSRSSAVRHACLGEITTARFEVGGRYRRNV